MRAVLLLALCLVVGAQAQGANRPPNIVIIFCDDLGYGDLGCFGHPTIRTPNLDRMAAEGMKLTSFYVGASVCTPSRAALLTGRLPIRSGMCSDRRRVLFPDSAGGLPSAEVTIAEVLKPRGYATACVGKWHLGHLPQYLPTQQGFDTYFGIPYSNDMDRVSKNKPGRSTVWEPRTEDWNVPLLRGTEVIERPANQNTITQRYTAEAVKFIQQNKGQPFFLYMAHTMPHIPLFASEAFRGNSPRGLFGDVIEEIDASVGSVLAALKEAGVDEQTLVVFTSDNGPWLVFNHHGGSAGLLREGKGSTWEGGMRVACLMRWPGQIPAGSVRQDIVSSLDLLPTCAALAEAKLPTNRVLDGYDLRGFLTDQQPAPRDAMFYYRGEQLYAVRQGPYKAHFITRSAYGRDKPVRHDTPELYHLGIDPGEKRNIAKDHPEVVASLTKLAEEHKAGVKPGEVQLIKRIPRKKTP